MLEKKRSHLVNKIIIPISKYVKTMRLSLIRTLILKEIVFFEEDKARYLSYNTRTIRNSILIVPYSKGIVLKIDPPYLLYPKFNLGLDTPNI